MDWQPQDEPLRQLVEYLKDSLNGYDQEVRKHAEQVSLIFSLWESRVLGFWAARESSPYSLSVLANDIDFRRGRCSYKRLHPLTSSIISHTSSAPPRPRNILILIRKPIILFVFRRR